MIHCEVSVQASSSNFLCDMMRQRFIQSCYGERMMSPSVFELVFDTPHYHSVIWWKEKKRNLTRKLKLTGDPIRLPATIFRPNIFIKEKID